MIRVTDTITLADDEIQEDFIRSPGPGGQHVNMGCLFCGDLTLLSGLADSLTSKFYPSS